MSVQIAITLSEEAYRQAERFARLANCDLATVLTNTIERSLPPVSLQVETIAPVSTLSDEEVLALTQLQMESDADKRLSELLDCQQEGWLSEGDRVELDALMQVYQEGLLRKATALREAVRRGLIEPLES